jgi:release factor glutamine methyltransferase
VPSQRPLDDLLTISHKTHVRDSLEVAAHLLTKAGCETPRVDAELLLAHVLDRTRSALHADSRRALSVAELTRFEALVARRARREPVAYLLGEWGFRRLVLSVDRRVLVPRPETETVVERALELLRGLPAPCVLDVGTGSGAIALAIADEHPGAHVTALDSSSDALTVARENAERLGLAVELVRFDLFDGLPEGQWNLVVSNPPYVRLDEVDALPPEVREWEPRAALVGEGATEAIAQAATGMLTENGALVLETADGDAGRVAALLSELGFEAVRVTSDLTGRERVVEGRR